VTGHDKYANATLAAVQVKTSTVQNL